MNFPERPFDVPTDNLYKFVALFGLACTLASAYAVLQLYQAQAKAWEQHLEQTRRVGEAISEIETAIHGFQTDVKTFDSELMQIEEAVRRIKNGPHAQQDLEALLRRLAVVKSESERVLAANPVPQFRAVAARTKDNSSEYRLLAAEHDRRATLFYLAVAGIALGFAIAFVGFTLWYERVQRILDERVRRDASL